MKKVLSLFSGCGGLDLGLEGDFKVHVSCVNEKLHPDWLNQRRGDWAVLPKTSFYTVFANDILPAAKIAWDNYFQKRNKDIPRHFCLESIVDLVKGHREGRFSFPKDIDVLTGGFPCQDFSVAGKRKGFKSHKSHNNTYINHDDASVESRGMLYYWMREVIDIVRPKVFIAENVKGLLSLKAVKETIENDFKKIGGDGYHVLEVKLLHAADFGVSQSRQRVIFIGILKSALKTDILDIVNKTGVLPDNLDFYPISTHSMTDTNLKPYANIENILSDLKEPDKETTDLSQIHYSKAKWMGKHCQGQTEIKLQSISPTIRSEHHGNIEFRRLSKKHGGKIISELEMGMKERRLTVRECARIQSFPDEYEFVIQSNKKEKKSLSASMAYKIIGNAVPPLLSYNLAQRMEYIWDQVFVKESDKQIDNINKQRSVA